MRGRQFFALAVLALIVIFAAVALALSQTGSAPSPSGGAAPAQASSKTKNNAPQEPKIVRWVCTDRICGGCDGKCSRHGHVATDKAGHCACTPNEGSALDKAIRKAFQGHEKGQ